MCKFLVVVDMQKDNLKALCAEKTVTAAVEKIKRRAEEGYEILLTQDKCGGEIDRRIMRLCRGRTVYKKHSYGCAALISALSAAKPEAVEFIGVCTDVCVMVNAVATLAFLPFAEIIVDAGCCAAQSAATAALTSMQSCGINVINCNRRENG